MQSKMITLRLAPELHRQLIEAAARSGLSLNVFCLRALSAKLDKLKDIPTSHNDEFTKE